MLILATATSWSGTEKVSETESPSCQTVCASRFEGIWNAYIIYGRDLANRNGGVFLPFALERKYPNADKSWPWQYVFPADKLSSDPRSGEARRHHVSENNLQKAVKTAIHRAGIRKA